jgi:acyl-CoA synthetase (AMP-forming)/AMP-acid ligase II
MGLVGCFIFTLYWQLHGVFMTPYHFLRRPGSWLKAISEFGGTLSPAPNFAYALAARRTTEKEAAALDLSSWRAAMCGAEQIDINTLQSFNRRFEAYGFRAGSLIPCYGMAEASLCVSMHQPSKIFNYERVSRSTLAEAGQAVLTDQTDASQITLVCDCGQPVDGMTVRILDEAGTALPDGHVGQIWISGPSLSPGYFGAAELNAQLFQDGWLKTGDLGYMRAGHLFVTGRSKELIVIRGHNYQPTEFEWAAAQIDGLAAGRVVAFSAFSPDEGTEQLYLVCERPRKSELSVQALAEEVKRHVGRSTGVLPAHVAFVPRNTIPKTTSGKVQRAKTKSLYFALGTGEVAHA